MASLAYGSTTIIFYVVNSVVDIIYNMNMYSILEQLEITYICTSFWIINKCIMNNFCTSMYALLYSIDCLSKTPQNIIQKKYKFHYA